MRWPAVAALLCGLVGARLAHAQDRLSVTGELDLRYLSDTGDTSFLNGGLGTLRFDSEHDGLRLGQAFLDSRYRINDVVSAHADVVAYGDHERNLIDLNQAWIEARPFPTGSVRWDAKLGAFFLPVSLENRGPNWTDVYTITPSALNTWIGEEFRTIGAEVEARWLGASRDYIGDVALVAAAYGWNDQAGALLAKRGFALTDRPSTLFGGLGHPAVDDYHEVDHTPGYYAGLTWRHHDRLEIRALHYDNLADPGATTSSAFAWRTRFSTLGARLEPSAPWTFIAQYLDGDTAVGDDYSGTSQFRMSFRAAFLLASLEWRRERFTARFDDFRTHQSSGFSGLPSDDVGHAWTLGWMHEAGYGLEFAAEWIRASSRFPPRVVIGKSAGLIESQLQVAIRYRFHCAT